MNPQISVTIYIFLTIFDRTQFCESSRLVFRPPIQIDSEQINVNTVKHKTNMQFNPVSKSDHLKAPFEFLHSLIFPYINTYSKSTSGGNNASRPFYPMNVNFNFNKNENNLKTNTSVEIEWEFEFELGSYSSGSRGSSKSTDNGNDEENDSEPKESKPVVLTKGKNSKKIKHSKCMKSSTKCKRMKSF